MAGRWTPRRPPTPRCATGECLASAQLTGYDQIHLVGRVLSGLFDLGSVLLLFFLARRLFDWRVGLIASFLLALTALNIQGSHYFAVDTFLTFFVMLTIWFTLDVAEGKGWPAFVGLGLSMGLTLACKVSVFLLVAVVALGAWVWLRRRRGARAQHRPGACSACRRRSGAGSHRRPRRLSRGPALCLGRSQL